MFALLALFAACAPKPVALAPVASVEHSAKESVVAEPVYLVATTFYLALSNGVPTVKFLVLHSSGSEDLVPVEGTKVGDEWRFAVPIRDDVISVFQTVILHGDGTLVAESTMYDSTVTLATDYHGVMGSPGYTVGYAYAVNLDKGMGCVGPACEKFRQ